MGHDPGFHEILGHSPHPAFIKLKSFFAETVEFIRFHMKSTRFHLKSTGFHEYELLGDHQV